MPWVRDTASATSTTPAMSGVLNPASPATSATSAMSRMRADVAAERAHLSAGQRTCADWRTAAIGE